MSLSFLVPAFLVGLLALAIPVLIHLARRRSEDSIPFPSLMFLGKIEHPSANRRQIQRWPLFLLRSLAVLLLVLAFSRPLVERGGTPLLTSAEGEREIVVLLDRSFPMAYADRWERARAEADRIVSSLPSGDRATLLLFDDRPVAAVEASMDPAELSAAVREAAPVPRATRYGPALRYAERVLAESPMPRRELVLISGFPREAWEREAGELSSVRLPPRTQIRMVPVVDASAPGNVAIVSVEHRRTLVEGRERVALTARLATHGEVEGPIPVTLELDGREIESQRVTLGGDATGSAEFSPITLPATGSVRARVHVPADALAFDDAYHLTLSAEQRVEVVVVEGAGAEAGHHLRRALAIGDMPGFRVTGITTGRLRPEDLPSRGVVVLNQAAVPTGAAGARLREWVEGGGGLILVLGTQPASVPEGLLPRSPGATVDLTGSGGIGFGFVDRGHPVFEPFSSPRSGEFASARAYRYRPVEGVDVLARFSDGGIALGEHRVGRGRVLVWTSTLDPAGTDLPVQPVFLPFVHQLVKYAAGYAPPRPALAVGEAIEAPGGPDAGFTLAVAPDGERIELVDGAPFEPDRIGFWEILDPASGGRGPGLAVNAVHPPEVLESVDPGTGAELFGEGAAAAGTPAAGAGLTAAQRERQQNAWWWLLVAALLLLGIEMVAANRLGRDRGAAAIGTDGSTTLRPDTGPARQERRRQTAGFS